MCQSRTHNVINKLHERCLSLRQRKKTTIFQELLNMYECISIHMRET